MEGLLLTLRCARAHDEDVITGLIDAAANWLRTKNTDQWAEPWPSEADRQHRIRRDLLAGKTWIAWDGARPVATITTDRKDSEVWPWLARRERAVYVSRLVVSRDRAGEGIGAALLDWAGLRARQRYGARWVRVDVWTTNAALHAYYQKQGFDFCGFCEASPRYPSAALFQKATRSIQPTWDTMFRLDPPLSG
jgi:GNAT superfamily N-acetyltransferase